MPTFTIHRETTTSKIGLQLESCQGSTYIINIVEGGISDTAGLKVGMNVTRVNGTKVVGAIQATGVLKALTGNIDIEAVSVTPNKRSKSFYAMFKTPSGKSMLHAPATASASKEMRPATVSEEVEVPSPSLPIDDAASKAKEAEALAAEQRAANEAAEVQAAKEAAERQAVVERLRRARARGAAAAAAATPISTTSYNTANATEGLPTHRVPTYSTPTTRERQLDWLTSAIGAAEEKEVRVDLSSSCGGGEVEERPERVSLGCEHVEHSRMVRAEANADSEHEDDEQLCI